MLLPRWENPVSYTHLKNGVVFDPFLGTGTTWIVSDRLERNCIGFEINQEFVDFAQSRFKESREFEQ